MAVNTVHSTHQCKIHQDLMYLEVRVTAVISQHQSHCLISTRRARSGREALFPLTNYQLDGLMAEIIQT